MNTTKTAQFTPGPWVAALGERLNTDVYCTDAQGNRIFIAEFATQADAVLGAAAPAMYEALKGLLALQLDCDGIAVQLTEYHCHQVRAAQAALAQAEGRQA